MLDTSEWEIDEEEDSMDIWRKLIILTDKKSRNLWKKAIKKAICSLIIK
ncbi:MAG: hypothetical protein LBS53_08945 [Synergistaceae bacterium]|nr:hypothetical protein [Synergistaceae bacterium]